MVYRVPDFEFMFRAGARYRWSGREDSIQEIQPIGNIKLATGRLIACDPFWGPRALRQVLPFTVAVEPGGYPVALAVARWDSSGHPNVPGRLRSVAAAKVVIRDEPVVAWEPARRSGDPADEGKAYGFAVDKGVGCFLDASAMESLMRMNHYGGVLDDALPEIDKRCAVDLVDADSGLNIIAFSCPLGAGSYPTWIGHTEAGDVACFVSHLEWLHHSLGPATA
ncbi:MAG: DUF4241 domain-containing protein [Actinomycetes bacterium]